MTTVNDARKAHELLDELDARAELSQEQEKLLRSFLPEPPKQKTLAEICEDVALSLDKTSGDQWEDECVYLESWLTELHAQLQGLKDAPVAVPALPAGMRLADHEKYGRVVVSTTAGKSGNYMIFILDNSNGWGSSCTYADCSSLTFIDAEPAKPVRPEFLETEADYQKAPEGTVAAQDGWLAWIKEGVNDWTCSVGAVGDYSMAQSRPRRVLRWGWGE